MWRKLLHKPDWDKGKRVKTQKPPFPLGIGGF